MKIILSAVALTALIAQSNDFISTWKAPGAAPTSFAGQKVAAVLIVDDHNLRVSADKKSLISKKNGWTWTFTPTIAAGK